MSDFKSREQHQPVRHQNETSSDAADQIKNGRLTYPSRKSTSNHLLTQLKEKGDSRSVSGHLLTQLREKQNSNTHLSAASEASAEQGSKGIVQKKAKSTRFSDDESINQLLDGKLMIGGGTKGLMVRKIQQALADAGYLDPGKVTGNYDTDTLNAVKAFQTAKGFKGKEINGIAGAKTMGLLDSQFSDYSVENKLAKDFDPAAPDKGTRKLDGEDRKGIKDIISTEVKANPVTGKLPTFVPDIKGKGTYENRLYNATERVLLAQYNRYGKGKAADRKDPDKMHSWASIEGVAVESKKETDKVFGKYKKGAPLKANINLKDGWEDKEKRLKASTALQDGSAAWRVRKIVQGHRLTRQIDQEHGAVQSRVQEKAIIKKVSEKLVKKYRTELLETHKGWPGFAKDNKVFLQRYKSSTDAANRDYMWDKFRTIIHEYIHTLEHPDHISYRGGMEEKAGNKTLREGVVDYFTKTVWANVNFNDKTLRGRVENKFHDKKDPMGHPIPPMGAYRESANAERMAGLVGFPNVAAAFFLGKTENIGKV